VIEPKVPPAANQRAVALWGWTIILGPPVAFVLPLLATRLLGGFEDFQLINKPVTFLQSVGILGAMCFPFGAFLYARSKWNQARAHVSQTWPTVPGFVQSCWIEKRLTGLPLLVYKLALSYSYRVSGNEYKGNAVQFGPNYVKSKEIIEALEKKYPSGSAVTVHYDPGDPGTSVIETSDEMARQNRWQIWAYFLTPILISVVIAIKNSSP
jgi:hypothetical protein